MGRDGGPPRCSCGGPAQVQSILFASVHAKNGWAFDAVCEPCGLNDLASIVASGSFTDGSRGWLMTRLDETSAYGAPWQPFEDAELEFRRSGRPAPAPQAVPPATSRPERVATVAAPVQWWFSWPVIVVLGLACFIPGLLLVWLRPSSTLRTKIGVTVAVLGLLTALAVLDVARTA